jgi:hypothetical protein
MPNAIPVLCQENLISIVTFVTETDRLLGIAGNPFRLKAQPRLRTLDHSLGRRHLVVAPGWRGLHIDDDGMFVINQVVEPVTELNALVRLRRPGRTWIRERDYLRRFAIGIGGRIKRVEILPDCAGIDLWIGPVDRGAPVNTLSSFFSQYSKHRDELKKSGRTQFVEMIKSIRAAFAA